MGSMSKNNKGIATIVLIVILAFVGAIVWAKSAPGLACPKPEGDVLDEATLHLDGSDGVGWIDVGPLKVYKNLTIAKGNDAVACIKDTGGNKDYKFAKFEIEGNWGEEGLAKGGRLFFVSGNELSRTERFLSGRIENYPQLYKKPIIVSSELIVTENGPIERVEPFFHNPSVFNSPDNDSTNPMFFVLYVSKSENGVPVTVIGETIDIEKCNLRKQGWKFLSFSGGTPVLLRDSLLVEVMDTETKKASTRSVPMQEVYKELSEKDCYGNT